MPEQQVCLRGNEKSQKLLLLKIIIIIKKSLLYFQLLAKPDMVIA